MRIFKYDFNLHTSSIDFYISGCKPPHCKNCHNPELFDFNNGIKYNEFLLNNYNDIIKHIELCGRTCYKSEDKRTDSSAEKFVNMLKSNHHMSVLEHGTVYLDIPMNDNFSVIHNPYSVVKIKSYIPAGNAFPRIKQG